MSYDAVRRHARDRARWTSSGHRAQREVGRAVPGTAGTPAAGARR